ncbi:MAG: FeoC-like transcriptional regulator [Candidatus Saliniplasma sp.]
MSKRRSILTRIKEGKSLSEISQELDMGIGTVRAIVESLKYQGYLKEVNCGSKCSSCPIGCNSSNISFKVYKVTEKEGEL